MRLSHIYGKYCCHLNVEMYIYTHTGIHTYLYTYINRGREEDEERRVGRETLRNRLLPGS